jgi:hypothetical protein
MNRMWRFRKRINSGRMTARRAGRTAVGLVATTAAAAVLLAYRFHLGIAAVVIAVIGGIPGLYLAWAALPNSPDEQEDLNEHKALHGKLSRLWDPVDLGVHRVIGGGPLPPYIRRSHDFLLQAVLGPEVAANRLIAVRGGSSTGKSRAAYEAVLDLLPDWLLDYPLTAGALVERLEVGVGRRTVLWLGELRHYVSDVDGSKALGRLADLMAHDAQVVVITTLWPRDWSSYVDASERAASEASDPAAVAGRLLARLPELTGEDPAAVEPSRGGVIDVPDGFTAEEIARAVKNASPVLTEAVALAAAAGTEAQVAQYLAGVPDLRRHYDGIAGDPYGQAVITAAMDAARLGHASPLPLSLLQEAVVGYLTDQQRTTAMTGWWDAAFAYATRELKGAVRALKPMPPKNKIGVAGYRIADYLDQLGRQTRRDKLGPTSLWDALSIQTVSPGDLGRLADAAYARGLYRHAALLWTRAIINGNLDAPVGLVDLLRQTDPDQANLAIQWLTSRTPATKSAEGDNRSLGQLREAGASDAVAVLLARDPASAVGLEDPYRIAALLRELSEAGESDLSAALAARAATQTPLGNPYLVAGLLAGLREAGASDAVAALLARDPASAVGLEDPYRIAGLVRELRIAGASDAASALAMRAATQAPLHDPTSVATLLRELRGASASGAVAILANRAAARAGLDVPWGVASLLSELQGAGAPDAVATLASRAANAGMFDIYLRFNGEPKTTYTMGREPDGQRSQPWTWRVPDSHDVPDGNLQRSASSETGIL